MNTKGDNAPAWRDDCLKVRLQQSDLCEYIFLSASGARTTGRTGDTWRMKGTETKTAWLSAVHATDGFWSAETTVPVVGAPKTMRIFLESFNRTGVGEQRAAYKFRSWRRWFVSGGEADVVFQPLAKSATRTFTVRLHFCELEGARPGERVFDVSLQGKPVVRGLDIAAAVGPGAALVKEFPGVEAATDMTLEFTKSPGSKLPAVLCSAEVMEETQGE